MARNCVKFYTNVALTATYTLPSTCSHPARIYIHKACEILIGQHSILSAIPVDEDTTEPYFARLPEIHLDQCVFFKERKHPFPDPGDTRGDAELDELLHVQHNIPFAAPLPYWRLCVLTHPSTPHQFTLSFVFNHALGDGTAGKVFHKTFLNALQAAISSQELQSSEQPHEKLVIQSPKIPLLPNLEAVHPLPISIPYLLGVLFKVMVWKPEKPDYLWTGSKIFTPLKTKSRQLVISKPRTRNLKDACRKNYNTTITAALQVIVAQALFSALPEDFSQLRCQSSISVRRWLGDHITEDSIGVFTQSYHETYDRKEFFDNSKVTPAAAINGDDDDDNNNNNKNGGAGNETYFPWHEAQRSRQSIQEVLDMKGKNANVGLLKYASDYINNYLLPSIGKDRENSFELSNLGVFKSGFEGEGEDQDQSQARRPRIGRMVFSQSANVAGSPINVSAVTGEDGCLVLTFNLQDGAVEDALFDEFVRRVDYKLNTLQ